MGKQWEKYLRKTTNKQSIKLEKVALQILSCNFDWLDIKKLEGKKNLWRCRVGDIRIVYRHDKDGTIEILVIKPRGDVY